MENKKQKILAQLPQVDKLLQHPRLRDLGQEFPRELMVEVIREELEALRKHIQQMALEELESLPVGQEGVVERICGAIQERLKPKLRRAINASGIILHTGLGRAPLSPPAKDALLEVAEGYSTMEIELETGRRGDRQALVEDLLIKLTGAEAALVVNNNAAATLLALNTLASRQEIIVSRGELITIGGSFRLPEIMKRSGARMVEVGTTNQTSLEDYRQAITERTALILKVHTSNYKIIGFVADVPLVALVALGREYGLPVMHDLGSGMLFDLSRYGLPKEPVVRDSIQAGADVVTFSGDKLLGGPQAGILVGRKKYIDLMKKNQLTRALRCCKLTFAALEATLRLFLDQESLLKRHAVMRLLTRPISEIEAQAKVFIEKINDTNVMATIEDSLSEVGGGSLATESLPTKLVSLQIKGLSADELARSLRLNHPPIIARIRDDKVLLDFRTIGEDETDIITQAMQRILTKAREQNKY
ncbi:MAG: L-seryl-tRNA(Sec) selenium transferase [candidate division KSB1 bacterium]|nr:L-seryl-tRNA(Sec) selenium transferase [candidate division KSB1 bacterium]